MTCATISPATAQNIAEVWEDNANDDLNGDWFDRRISENPSYAAFVERMLEEAELAKNEGRVVSHDEVVSQTRWKLANGIL